MKDSTMPTAGQPHSNAQNILWSLPQPMLVFSSMLLMASALVYQWMDPDLLFVMILVLQFPIVMLAERFFAKRDDWLLNGREFAEDGFWVFGTYLVWVPAYDAYYDTPIAAAFTALRENMGLSFALEASSVGGLFFMALVAAFAMEFIGYWAHRLEHRFMFFWRIHATHHHITKMSIARADRTHPLEFLGLNLGGAVMLAFFGATPEVVAVSIIFRLTTAHLNHANLPMTSGWYGLVFTTAEWHQLHHSQNKAESDTNYGCTIILWDRLFGTFSGKTSVERLGNGTGQPLGLLTQLSIPFRSSDTLRSL